ncbi:DUF6695 family protein [Flavicella sp.]|uniref:DUF6695 family protein n=1 Tax=Flavicella sp. TaxID=2957742 RepID=UPI003017A37F
MDRNTGFIVIIAYPEVIVQTANGELISKIWPLFGVGGRQKVRAGHAAMLLVSKCSNKISYFDFGRYITSDKNGRVRSEQTDNETHIPIAASHNGKEILNLEEILLYLDKNPDKTHGEGRLVAGVNSEIDYDKALDFIRRLQDKGEVLYGAFIKEGSNCARFVTDTLIASTTNNKILRKLKLSCILTPSPISNVLRGSSKYQCKFEVENQEVRAYLNKFSLREHKKYLFSKVPQEVCIRGSIEPNTEKYVSPNGQWLGGIGSGAWFELREKLGTENLYYIKRRNYNGEIDLAADFISIDKGFSAQDPFEFQYGSNCKICLLKQNNKVYRFYRKDE